MLKALFNTDLTPLGYKVTRDAPRCQYSVTYWYLYENGVCETVPLANVPWRWLAHAIGKYLQFAERLVRKFL